MQIEKVDHVQYHHTAFHQGQLHQYRIDVVTEHGFSNLLTIIGVELDRIEMKVTEHLDLLVANTADSSRESEGESDHLSAGNPKMLALQKWKGKNITLENVHSNPFIRSQDMVLLLDFDDLMVRVESSGARKTIPMDQLDISHDDLRDQLKLEWRRAK